MFVGNRAAEIIDEIPPAYWCHVSGMQNPTDCASRGLFPAELAQCNEWWHGPTWLRQLHVEYGWPDQLQIREEPEASEEQREQPVISLLNTKLSLPLIERVSSYTQLCRVTSWIF